MFAVGEANNMPVSKTGVTAHLEAKVVAEILDGKSSKFIGRINCPFDTAYGKATFVISDYNNPTVPYPATRFKHFEKMMMARIYWGTLKGTYDPVFDYFFKFTAPEKLLKKIQIIFFFRISERYWFFIALSDYYTGKNRLILAKQAN